MIQSTNFDYFLSEGFTHVGMWKKKAKELDFTLDENWTKRPAVYVFIDSNDQVLYIGRSEVDLESAMKRIKLGPEAQVTNHRLHNDLLKHLEKPLSVEILAYTTAKEHTDVAAYFDEIKKKLTDHTSPLWNLRG